jgi:S1-C subfamily serine protease
VRRTHGEPRPKGVGRRRRTATLLTCTLATLAAGCGGSDTTTVTVERNTTIAAPAANGTAKPIPRGQFDPRAIYEKDAAGVVTIISLYSEADGLDGRGAEGSGFVLNEQGEIATNAHVVTQGTGSDIREVEQVFVRFTDRNQVEAEIVGFDPNEDVALLKIDPDGLDLQPLELGSSENLVVGAPVAAIGSPFGEAGSLSIGVISALDRTLESLTRFSISGAIQTDAAINHGNSGGPLVDARGRVLGINSQINSSTGDNSGVGYAIPIDSVRRSIDQLRRTGRVDYAYLGVSTSSLYPQLADRLSLGVDHGAVVETVVAGGPAEKAGLRGGGDRIRFQGDLVPTEADVIVGIGDDEVVREDDLGRLLAAYDPGDEVTLDVLRGKERRKVRVTLGSRPKNP